MGLKANNNEDSSIKRPTKNQQINEMNNAGYVAGLVGNNQP